MLTVATIVALVSCESRPELYNSATLDYAGRFVMTEFTIARGDYGLPGDGDTTLVIDDELAIYNTTADVANEIWVKCDGLDVYAKQTISGSPESFTSQWGVNMKGIVAADDLPLTLAAGRDTIIDSVDDAAMRIVLASIVKNGTTSPGGNTVDALNAKVEFCQAKVFYKSLLRDKSVWADSTIAEYGWKFSHIEAYDGTAYSFVINGYRYTGLPEDM